jgi:putative transposase
VGIGVLSPVTTEDDRLRRAHVVRLYPTSVQGAALEAQAHTARALWNLLHEWYTWGDGGTATRLPPAEIDRQLRDARTNPVPGYEWLAQLPAQATQQLLKQYLRAWRDYHSGLTKRPRFKRRGRQMTVDNPQAETFRVVRLNRRWAEVTIQMVGRVRFRWTSPLPGISRGCKGRITGARIVRDPLGWHMSFRIEEPATLVQPNSGPQVGVDRGVVHTMALSDGRFFDMPPLLTEGEQRRLRRLELQAARCRQIRHRHPGTPISNRERRAYQQIGALRARQTRRRKDWLHTKTTDLAKNHRLVVLEDLQIQCMTRSARGTIDKPGTRVKAKASLNRSILAMAWGTAARMLAYKCPANGGELAKVYARNSSLECARCGHVARANRVGQALLSCVACGHRANADTNAAQVLLARGLAAHSGIAPGHGVAGRQSLAAGRAAKRQPPTETPALAVSEGASSP